MTAFLFWLLFNERLSLNHLVGMSLLVVTIILVKLSNDHVVEESEVAAVTPIWVPLVYVSLSAMSLTGLNVLFRIWTKTKYQMDPA
jgi:hypothetical protein